MEKTAKTTTVNTPLKPYTAEDFKNAFNSPIVAIAAMRMITNLDPDTSLADSPSFAAALMHGALSMIATNPGMTDEQMILFFDNLKTATMDTRRKIAARCAGTLPKLDINLNDIAERLFASLTSDATKH